MKIKDPMGAALIIVSSEGGLQTALLMREVVSGIFSYDNLTNINNSIIIIKHILSAS